MHLSKGQWRYLIQPEEARNKVREGSADPPVAPVSSVSTLIRMYASYACLCLHLHACVIACLSALTGFLCICDGNVYINMHTFHVHGVHVCITCRHV